MKQIKKVICVCCGDSYRYSPFKDEGCCGKDCYRENELNKQPIKLNKCKFCHRGCKLDFCSFECGRDYKKIIRDIEHQKVLDSLDQRQYTDKEEKTFREIKRVLCK